MDIFDEKELTKLERKYGADFCLEVRKLDKEGFDKKLLELAKYRQSLINTRDNDPDLRDAKRKANNLAYPYTKDLTANLEKQRLVTLIMIEEGLLEDDYLPKDSDSDDLEE